MIPPNRRRVDMDQLLSAFQRASDGSWTCREAAVLYTHAGAIRFTPGARFTPGWVFMGIDVARVFNDYYGTGLAPLDWRGECPPTRKWNDGAER
jgi:hypothetical protein